MRERYKSKREALINQEQLIKQLADTIKRETDLVKSGDESNFLIENKEKVVELEAIKFQRDQLEQKLKQVKLLGKLSEGDIIPDE